LALILVVTLTRPLVPPETVAVPPTTDGVAAPALASILTWLGTPVAIMVPKFMLVTVAKDKVAACTMAVAVTLVVAACPTPAIASIPHIKSPARRIGCLDFISDISLRC
jgi:hypothetical protein